MSNPDRERYKKMFLTIDDFLHRPRVIKEMNNQIGTDYVLSDIQRERLEKLLENFSKYTLIDCENFKTVITMIKYDVNNYCGRLRRILDRCHSKRNIRYMYVLKCGKEEGLRQYQSFINARINDLPIKIDFWLRKGYSEEDAKRLIKEHQHYASLFSAKKIKGSSEYTCRSLSYWLRKGYSEEDAKKELKRVQGTFSLEKCIKKYGEKEGQQIWKNRQDKWLQSLNNKNENEKNEINFRKGHSIESYMANGYSEKEAIKKSREYYNKRNNYSLISQKCFELLEEKYNGKFYYKLKNYEKQFNGKNVDCYEKNSKIVIEFYGDFWHCRQGVYTDDFIRYNEKASDVRKKDSERLEKILQNSNVSNIIIVWELDFRKNPTLCLEKIIEKMEQLNGKNSNSKRIEEIVC
nr:MAG TPA: very short patch repair protein [Caudoviricetes sp.]